MRKIIHLDLDAFFCSVEELFNPALREKPFAVGGRPDQRGVVSSCSYPARQYQIHSALPMARAVKLCPNLIIVPPRHHLYSQVSHKVMDRLSELAPLIEQISIDEAFLDFSNSTETGESIAEKLQAIIREEFSLPCSLGVATNKLVAKIATDVGKAAARKNQPPNAITVVPPGDEAKFLSPLPVEALWGVGPKTAERLRNLNVLTIGDLAMCPEIELMQIFGKNGYYLARHAKGIDDSPIRTEHDLKSISQEVTFARDVKDISVITDTLLELSKKVGKRLRAEQLWCTTVKIKIRWPDFSTTTRQMTTSTSFDSDQEIFQFANSLFMKIINKNQPIRLVGVGVSGLDTALRQLSLWKNTEVEASSQSVTKYNEKIDAAINDLNLRYGKNILHRGAMNSSLHERDDDGE